MSWNQRVVFMTGGTRGIGLAIAERLAREGARIAFIAKTADPHPKLAGTLGTAADAIARAGGVALPIQGDVRDADSVESAVASAVERFGGIDVVVNNASAIDLRPARDLEIKRFDLMLDVNVRGTFVTTKACLPHLRRSSHPHVLTLSPPLRDVGRWLRDHSAYTASKMGMTMVTLGVAADEPGIAANCLWPRTVIATAAVGHLWGDEGLASARTPEVMADAAFEILSRDPRTITGQTLIDDEVLAESGVEDLSGYAAGDGDLRLDLFVDGWGAGASRR